MLPISEPIGGLLGHVRVAEALVFETLTALRPMETERQPRLFRELVEERHPTCDPDYLLFFSSGFTAALNSYRSLAALGLVLLRIGRLRRGRSCFGRRSGHAFDARIKLILGNLLNLRRLQRHFAAALLIFKGNGPCLGLIDLRGVVQPVAGWIVHFVIIAAAAG